MIEAGGTKARKICDATMGEVRQSMGLTRNFEPLPKTAGAE